MEYSGSQTCFTAIACLSCLYRSQLRPALDLATQEGCKAELT